MSYEILSNLTERRTIKVNGKPVEATIGVAISYETDSVVGSVDFGDKNAEQDYYKRFETGELLNLVLRVEASALGLSGTDYLGGVHIKASELERDTSSIVSEHGMIDVAISELTQEITDTAKRLREYA